MKAIYDSKNMAYRQNVHMYNILVDYISSIRNKCKYRSQIYIDNKIHLIGMNEINNTNSP